MKWTRKWWWVIVTILAVALIIGWEEERCQAEAYQCRASYAAQAQLERLTRPISIDQQASEQQAIAATCEPNGYFCRLFSAANLPTMFLVLIGIGGVWAALRTLSILEAQTLALINSERAWVDGEIIKTVTIGVVRHALTITNHGKTPAEIFSYEIWSGFLTEGEEFSPQNLSNFSIQNLHVFLGSEKSQELREFKLEDMFSNEDSGGESGAIYVRIRYADVVTKPERSRDVRETSFLDYYRALVSSIDRISAENKYS